MRNPLGGAILILISSKRVVPRRQRRESGRAECNYERYARNSSSGLLRCFARGRARGSLFYVAISRRSPRAANLDGSLKQSSFLANEKREWKHPTSASTRRSSGAITHGGTYDRYTLARVSLRDERRPQRLAECILYASSTIHRWILLAIYRERDATVKAPRPRNNGRP